MVERGLFCVDEVDKWLKLADRLEEVRPLVGGGSCSANWYDVVVHCRAWWAACGVFLLYGSPKYGLLKWGMDKVRTEFLKFKIPCSQ